MSCQVLGHVLAHWSALLERFQHLVEREAADLLARREFLERRQELPDVLLRRHEQEDVLDPPLLVAHAIVVGRLERIGAQVEDLRQAQRHERFLPDIEAVRALLGEDDLPLVVAQADQRAVVVEVEELVARAGRFAGQRIGDVVAVEMDLEGLVADLHALEQLLLHVRDARRGQQRGQHVFVREDVVVTVPGLMTPGQRIAQGTR